MDRNDEERMILDALTEWVGGIVTSFVIVAEFVDGEGDRCITGRTMPGQPYHTSLGLLAWAETFEREAIADARRLHSED